MGVLASKHGSLVTSQGVSAALRKGQGGIQNLGTLRGMRTICPKGRSRNLYDRELFDVPVEQTSTRCDVVD